MIVCPKCQRDVAGGKFCPECGTPLVEVAPGADAQQVAVGAMTPVLAPAQPKAKRKTWLWVVAGIVVVFIAFIALSGGGSVDVDSSKPLITANEWDKVLGDPNAYRKYPVEIVGRVFTDPHKSGDTLQFQIWTQPLDSEGNTFVELKAEGASVKRDTLVKVKGVLAGEMSGKNAFGATLRAPIIQATSVEQATFSDIDPARKTFQGTTITQNGVSLTMDKVELGKRYTRVFLTLENMGKTKFSLYSLSAAVVVGSTQLEDEYVAEEYIPRLQTDVAPGVKSSGVLVFSAAPESTTSLNLSVEGSSDDWNIRFRPFQFVLGEGQAKAQQSQQTASTGNQQTPPLNAGASTGTSQQVASPTTHTLTYGWDNAASKVVAQPASLTVKVGDTINLKPNGDPQGYSFSITAGDEVLEWNGNGYTVKKAGKASLHVFIKGNYPAGSDVVIQAK